MVHNMDHDFSLDDMDLGSLEDFGSLETIDELNFQNLNTHQHIFNENKCDSQQTVDAESTQVRQGEVAMLRERLSKFEMDRHEMVLKNSMRIETLEKEHQKKIKELHEQLERLSTIQAFDSNRQFDSLKTIPNHIRSQLYDSENFNSHLPPRTVNDPRLDSMKDFSPLKGIAKTQNKSAECQSEDFGTENSIINASYHRESYITRSHTIVPDLLPMQTISCERHQSTTVAKPSSNSRNKFYNESENLTPDHHQKILCNHSNSMKFITTTSASPTKMLFISIGYADQVWLKRDVTDGDRLAASKRRQSLIENLTETSNPLMSLKYTLETICGSKKYGVSYYILLITQFFICLHPEICEIIGSAWEKKLSDCTMDYSTSSLNDDSNHPDSGQNNEKMSGIRIIEILLQYFRDLPTGFSPSIVRQILQILKHLAKFLKETIIDLLLDGSITSKLSICSYEILIDFIQLLKLVRDSPRFAQAITTPLSIDANVIETSTLSIINKTITDQIEISPISKPINGLTRFLFRFLYETYQLGLLPASILFEPGLLRMIARRMSEIVTDAKIELKQEILSDFQVYTMIMHRVTVSEKAPIVRILIREVFSLMAAVSKLSRNSEFAMMKKSNVEFNEIFNSLHSALDTIATELHSGKYNARPIPIFRTRERRLTIDEELQIYNQIFSQSI